MITIFNRKELLVTYDMKVQGEIRVLLQDNGIDYEVKTINRKSASPMSAGSRARTGSFGEDMSKAYEYVIYVKKDDYERAKALADGR